MSEPYSIFARYYDEGWGAFSAYAAELIGEIESALGTYFGSICDVGCGTGLFLAAMNEGRRRLFGLDSAAAMLSVAQRRVPEAALHHGDMRSDPPWNEQFDLVSAFHDTLNYLTDPRELSAFFVRWARVVRPEGGVLMADLNGRALYRQRTSRPAEYALRDALCTETIVWYEDAATAVTTLEFTAPAANASSAATADPGTSRVGSERHTHRAYEIDEVESAMRAGGLDLFEVIEVYDAERDEPSGKRLYVALRA